jgi:hypothetical protein
VPARNDHTMIMSAAVMVPFTYAGPYIPQPAGYTGSGAKSIAISAPSAGSTVNGSSFSMSVDVANFVLCGTCFGKGLVAGQGHWHIFVDAMDMAHMLTMGGGPTQTVSLKGVAPGWHTFMAALVDNDHMPFMDMGTGMPVPGTVTIVNLFVQ